MNESIVKINRIRLMLYHPNFIVFIEVNLIEVCCRTPLHVCHVCLDINSSVMQLVHIANASTSTAVKPVPCQFVIPLVSGS